jgi:hypothetical protein
MSEFLCALFFVGCLIVAMLLGFDMGEDHVLTHAKYGNKFTHSGVTYQLNAVKIDEDEAH